MRRTKAQLEARLEQEQIVTERLRGSVNHLSDQIDKLQSKLEQVEEQRDRLLEIAWLLAPDR